eukprot:Skav234612  [mRNA]  locus=scaffold1110:429332:432147:- [translate_table: standard]
MYGQTDYTRTEVGSRPGDSFADIIFGYLFAVVLKDVAATLRDRGLLDSVPISEHLGPWAPDDASIHWEEFTGVTWMDDTCLCLSHHKAPALLQKLGEAVSILLDKCQGYGLTPNLGPGKTEILLSVRGAGSRDIKWRCFGPQHGQVLPVVCEDTTHHVRIVKEYRHLGGRVTHKGTDTHEMRQRMAQAHSAYNDHRRLIFTNQHIPWSKRLELFEMLVLSRLAFGSESWSIDQVSAGAAFHNALIRLYKRLLRLPHDKHVTDEEVLRAVGLPSPSTFLRRARLRYLGTLYRCCTPFMWSILRLDEAWLGLVRSDLSWLWNQLSNASHLPDSQVQPEAWLTLIQNHPKYWKKLIQRGVRHEILQIQNQTEVQNMHHRIAHFLETAGFPAAPQLRDDPPPEAGFYGCLTCGIACRSKGGEGAHMNRRHGRVAAERRLIGGTQCGACLKEYHTSAKLQAHLRYSTDCRRNLIAQRVQHQPLPGIGSREGRAQDRAHDGALPVRQAHGPQRERALGMDFPDYDDFFVQCVMEKLVDITSDSAAVTQAIRTPDDAAHMGLDLDLLQRTFSDLCSPISWPMFSQSSRTTSKKQYDISDWERYFVELTKDQSLCHYMNQLHQKIPRTFGRHRYVLHAFSGRRRPGDVEWFMEDLRHKHDSVMLRMVSVDIVLHPELGDVSKATTRDTWYHGVRNQWIVAFLAGPPCETWSQARSHDLDQPGEPSSHHTGPRVIRVADQPWGMLSLRVREILQIYVGNILMSFTLELAVLMVIYGGSGLVEHPAPPADPTAASIWRQPVMDFLCSLPCSEWFQFDQGKLGAASRKPTAMLAIRLPSLQDRIREWNLTVQNPSAVSIGRDAHGKFLTAPLKEYSPALCGALATGISDAALGHPLAQNHVEESFVDLCAKMSADFGSHIGPDFAGT